MLPWCYALVVFRLRRHYSLMGSRVQTGRRSKYSRNSRGPREFSRRSWDTFQGGRKDILKVPMSLGTPAGAVKYLATREIYTRCSEEDRIRDICTYVYTNLPQLRNQSRNATRSRNARQYWRKYRSYGCTFREKNCRRYISVLFNFEARLGFFADMR